MKKLLLSILLTITIYAENIKIPYEICSKHFDKVIKHGWNDDNATLNEFIVKSGTRAIPKFLTNLRTPLMFEHDPKIPNYHIPKLLVNRDQYKQLFAYVKYLEHENRMGEVQKIYTDALYGLKNIEHKESISLIFRIILEKILTTSIKESQERYGLSKELKDKLKEALLTNNDFLLEVVESENKIYNSFMKKYPQLIKINEEIQTHLITAIKNNSFDEFKQYKEEKLDALFNYQNIIKYGFLKGKKRLYRLVEIDTEYLDLFNAKQDMYRSTPSILKTYQEYLTQVKNNKIFLESLEEK